MFLFSFKVTALFGSATKFVCVKLHLNETLAQPPIRIHNHF
jgi:hypothetical protein